MERKKEDIYLPYQPMLVSQQGIVNGFDLFGHFPSLGAAQYALVRTMRRPLPVAALQGRPQTVLTGDAGLAEGLRPWLEPAGVNLQKTGRLPFVVEAFQAMAVNRALRDPASFGIWKTAGITEPLARRLYELASEFYRLAPLTTRSRSARDARQDRRKPV